LKNSFKKKNLIYCQSLFLVTMMSGGRGSHSDLSDTCWYWSCAESPPGEWNRVALRTTR